MARSFTPISMLPIPSSFKHLPSFPRRKKSLPSANWRDIPKRHLSPAEAIPFFKVHIESLKENDRVPSSRALLPLPLLVAQQQPYTNNSEAAKKSVPHSPEARFIRGKILSKLRYHRHSEVRSVDNSHQWLEVNSPTRASPAISHSKLISAENPPKRKRVFTRLKGDNPIFLQPQSP